MLQTPGNCPTKQNVEIKRGILILFGSRTEVLDPLLSGCLRESDSNRRSRAGWFTSKEMSKLGYEKDLYIFIFSETQRRSIRKLLIGTLGTGRCCKLESGVRLGYDASQFCLAPRASGLELHRAHSGSAFQESRLRINYLLPRRENGSKSAGKNRNPKEDKGKRRLDLYQPRNTDLTPNTNPANKPAIAPGTTKITQWYQRLFPGLTISSHNIGIVPVIDPTSRQRRLLGRDRFCRVPALRRISLWFFYYNLYSRQAG